MDEREQIAKEIRADVGSILTDIPTAEAELDAFLAAEIVANEGDRVAEAVARFGKSASATTFAAWRNIMKAVARRTANEDELARVPLTELKSLADITNNSVKNLLALKTKADERATAFTVSMEEDNIVNRLRKAMAVQTQRTDKGLDAMERNKLGVDREGNEIEEGAEDDV